MIPSLLIGGSGPIPSETECLDAALARAMTVSAWEPPTDAHPWWRVVFARRDGTALLLIESWSDHLEADVYPTPGLAVAADPEAPPAGYGSIPYVLGRSWLGELLDRFQLWDGSDALLTLRGRLPVRGGGTP